MPAAEIDVSPDLVRRLLAVQQPDLADLAIELMANGWDNTMYRVGDVLVARLPRREVAAELVPAWGQPPVLAARDLHPANIVVHRGRISGVIDFGDITSGDPATDLSAAWMLLPAGVLDDFRAAYRPAGQHAASDDTWARARGWALVLSLAI
jgi:aminoglycoside phosphotransferase (APT) family kinase protein